MLIYIKQKMIQTKVTGRDEIKILQVTYTSLYEEQALLCS
jgi:hypothetical protein